MYDITKNRKKKGVSDDVAKYILFPHPNQRLMDCVLLNVKNGDDDRGSERTLSRVSHSEVLPKHFRGNR